MLGAAGIVEQLADCSRGHHRFGVVGCPPRESFALRESQLVAPLWGQDGSVGPLGDAGLGGPAAHAQRVVVGECGHSSWGGLRRGQQLGGQLSAFWLRHILCELHPCGIDILHDLGVPGDGSHGRRLWLPHRRHSRSRRGEARLERAAGHPPQDLGDHRAMLRGALGCGHRHGAVVACRLHSVGFESLCDSAFSAKILTVGISRMLFMAAAISDKCSRVPSLVNTLSFGKGTEGVQQHIVEHIVHSGVGFYICDVRVTTELVVKFMFKWTVLAFGISTALFANT
mmetsp:Transcript_7235/g.21881  ORF Transcript_7235/g.21881 Transcript_7235/m.21881 type:complete len:284 (-) Transcript_7235:164-1015(-)